MVHSACAPGLQVACADSGKQAKNNETQYNHAHFYKKIKHTSKYNPMMMVMYVCMQDYL